VQTAIKQLQVISAEIECRWFFAALQ